MVKFFKPSKFKVIVGLVWIIFIIVVQAGILQPNPFNAWAWKITGILHWPSSHFGDFGLWLWKIADPGIKESTESIESGLRLIKYLVVWPLMLIYIYLISSVLDLLYKNLKKHIKVSYV